MLNLGNVTINCQNFGTIIGVFLLGEKEIDIERRYLSFLHWKATGGDLEWWTNQCALFWVYSTVQDTAENKILKALTNAALFEIINAQKTKGTNPWPAACALAAERYSQIEWVNWLTLGVRNLDIHGLGHTVHAEKDTGNFDDDVLSPVIAVGKSTLGKYIEDPTYENDSENLQLANADEVGVAGVTASRH